VGVEREEGSRHLKGRRQQKPFFINPLTSSGKDGVEIFGLST